MRIILSTYFILFFSFASKSQVVKDTLRQALNRPTLSDLGLTGNQKSQMELIDKQMVSNILSISSNVSLRATTPFLIL